MPALLMRNSLAQQGTFGADRLYVKTWPTKCPIRQSRVTSCHQVWGLDFESQWLPSWLGMQSIVMTWSMWWRDSEFKNVIAGKSINLMTWWNCWLVSAAQLFFSCPWLSCYQPRGTQCCSFDEHASCLQAHWTTFPYLNCQNAKRSMSWSLKAVMWLWLLWTNLILHSSLLLCSVNPIPRINMMGFSHISTARHSQAHARQHLEITDLSEPLNNCEIAKTSDDAFLVMITVHAGPHCSVASC